MQTSRTDKKREPDRFRVGGGDMGCVIVELGCPDALRDHYALGKRVQVSNSSEVFPGSSLA